MSPSPFFRYRSNLAKRMTSAEDTRLRSHRMQQRRAAAISYTALALSALLLGGVVWFLWGEAFLFWATAP